MPEQNKSCLVWVALDEASGIFPRDLEIRKHKKSLRLYGGYIAVQIEIIATKNGTHGYAPTIDGVPDADILAAGAYSYDKADCAARTAKYFAEKETCFKFSDAEIETFKKFGSYFQPEKLSKMGMLFKVFAAHGINIEPISIVMPAGYTIEDEVLKDGDWLEKIGQPSIERKVKVNGKFFEIVGEKSAYDNPKDLLRFWRKVEGSPAYRFVQHVVSKGNDKSENRQKDYFNGTVNIAVESRMRFDVDDLERLIKLTGKLFYPHEGFYKFAIESKNDSAVKAFEAWKNREPFFFAGERLHEDSAFMWDGLYVRITSFSEDGERIIACHQEEVRDEENPYGKTKTSRVFKLTRENLAARSELMANLTRARNAVDSRLKELNTEWSFAYAKNGNIEILCCDCGVKKWGSVYGDEVKHIKIDALAANCECGTAFYVKPTLERLHLAFSDFTLDHNSSESLQAMREFFKLANAQPDKILALCRELVIEQEAKAEKIGDENET